MTKVQKLFFRMDLIDRLTKPAGRAFGKFEQLTKRAGRNISRFTQGAQKGFRNIAFGALGLVGAGHAIAGAMQPALEFNKAVGEVASLGVLDKELKSLKKSAFEFSNQYGTSATEFVAASYDIQSAIGGLADGELGEFTKASGVLAAATKSDVATITDYVGTMYGIFDKQANAMGKANWVKMLAGQTASAVQMFKTTGSEMASAFSNLGAGANTAGVAMNEQMAILGTLQASMSGSQAGTKYRAFLKGVGKAQEKLGMQFTDSAGRVLPMVDILGKLQGKFGAMDKQADFDTLMKAFGSGEAVGLIQLLAKNVNGLNGSINELGKQKGMGKAEEMAAKMVDPWDRFSAAIRNLRIQMGDLLLPILNPLMDKMANGVKTISKWTEMFPHLSRAVGYTALGILALVGVMALVSLVAGVASIAWGGLMTIMTLLTPIIALKTAVIWLSVMAWRAVTLAAFLFRVGLMLIPFQLMAVKVGMLALSATMAIMRGGLMALKLSWMVLNAVAYAFPGVWIAAALIAVVAGAVLLVTYWDELMAVLGKQEWFQTLQGMLGFVSDTLTQIGNSQWFNGLVSAFETIKDGFMGLVEMIVKYNPISLLSKGMEKLANSFGFGGGKIETQQEILPGVIPEVMPTNSPASTLSALPEVMAANSPIYKANALQSVGSAPVMPLATMDSLTPANINQWLPEPPQGNSNGIERKKAVRERPNQSMKGMGASNGGILQSIVNNQGGGGTHIENLIIPSQTKVDGDTIKQQLEMA